MYKKHKLVILPTNKKVTVGNIVTIPYFYILSDEEIKEGDWYMCWETINNIPSNHEISNKLLHSFCIGTDNYKKIIAATDKSLKFQINGNRGDLLPDVSFDIELPQMPQSFIEKYVAEYNKGNIITEVMVEYNECGPIGVKGLEHELWDELKVNSKDNTINIKPIKDSWSREEVVNLINKISEEVDFESATQETIDNWIEENL